MSTSGILSLLGQKEGDVRGLSTPRQAPTFALRRTFSDCVPTCSSLLSMPVCAQKAADDTRAGQGLKRQMGYGESFVKPANLTPSLN
mmetsp:Transcript_10130/g.19625  ORF Transcript_10130/g.19625 Transcript_10130/m.19625 type:complete len:87 (-) Transcript_10130:636-896(-)